MDAHNVSSNGYAAGDPDAQPAATGAPPAEIDPEVKELVFDWITETLQRAWLSPEAERKKVVKQLLLKWHPDKNADDPELALAATQHIQSELERLENGLPRSGTGGRYAPPPAGSRYTFFRREPFADDQWFHERYDEVFNSFMDEVRKKREEFRRQCDARQEASRLEQEIRQRERERKRREFDEMRRERQRREREEERERRQQEEERRRREAARKQATRFDRFPYEEKNDARQNGNRTGFEPSGDGSGRTSTEDMAKALVRQAEHDVKAAQNDMGLEEPAYEWACFKAHQAAEKTIKAFHLFKIGLKSNSHELSSLAASTRDPELMDLATKIQEIIGNNNKLYNLVLSDFTLIPHDEYTVENALEAVTCATDILERVKAMII